MAWLWRGIARAGSQGWLASRVRAEVIRLAGLVGAANAQVVLAERLSRRWLAQGGAPVIDPVGWFVGRGLPQRVGCWSLLCDDGVRMDTGAACASCESLRGDRRAMRQGVLAQLQVDGCAVDRGVWEAEVHRQVQVEAALAAVRREHAAEERAAREVLWSRQAEEARIRESERLEASCVDCGVPQAAGRCPVCTWRAGAEALLQEAVDLLLAAPGASGGGSGDRASLEALLRGDLAALVQEAVRDNAQDGQVAFARWSAAQQLRDAYRQSALAAWGSTSQAQVEAERAYAAARRRLQAGDPAAANAAATREREEAQSRAAQFLLAARLAEVTSARAVPQPRTDWRARCAELAARPLAHEAAARQEVAA